MFKQLVRWWRKKATSHREESSYEYIILRMGVLDALSSRTFSPSLAMRLSVSVHCPNIETLGDDIIEASQIVQQRTYYSTQWKERVRSSSTVLFSDFISDGPELIHPVDWLNHHRHYILKLVDGLLLVDDADLAYYNAGCLHLIEDIIAVINACDACVR